MGVDVCGAENKMGKENERTRRGTKEERNKDRQRGRKGVIR